MADEAGAGDAGSTETAQPSAFFVANAAEGGAPVPPAAAAAEPLGWREGDYAWTHSAPVEGFFLVLTVVIVPVAIVRWMRRLRRRTGA